MQKDTSMAFSTELELYRKQGYGFGSGYSFLLTCDLCVIGWTDVLAFGVNNIKLLVLKNARVYVNNSLPQQFMVATEYFSHCFKLYLCVAANILLIV